MYASQDSLLILRSLPTHPSHNTFAQPNHTPVLPPPLSQNSPNAHAFLDHPAKAVPASGLAACEAVLLYSGLWVLPVLLVAALPGSRGVSLDDPRFYVLPLRRVVPLADTDLDTRSEE